MKNHIFHLHLTRTGGKSICGAILRQKKYKYLQLSKFFSGKNFESSSNKEKMDKLLNYLRINNKFEKPLFITGHVDLNPYFFSNNFKIFTVLRNPINRFKSHLSSVIEYSYDNTNSEILNEFNDLNFLLKNPKQGILKINQSNLSEFNKEYLLLFLKNGQSRQLSNISYNEVISDNELLEIALERITNIDFISTSENLRENFHKLKNLLDLPFYYHLPGINKSSSNKFNNIVFNKEFFNVNKIDYFIWKMISILERNYIKNSKINLIYSFEECDRYLFHLAKNFKYKLLNIFDKYRESS